MFQSKVENKDNVEKFNLNKTEDVESFIEKPKWKME